jgi:hypothetical protein
LENLIIRDKQLDMFDQTGQLKLFNREEIFKNKLKRSIDTSL